MITCAYCARPATTTIVANPHRVCLEHAVEFWSGLLDYTRGRSAACVKHVALCECPACEQMEAERLRAFALSRVGPSPGDHVDFGIALAS
jgi:hypothetical protein